MHELSIATSILDIVEEQLVKSDVNSPVEKIHFIAGKMHAIIPDSLTFHFDVVKKDRRLMKDALLVIKEVNVKIRCPSCQREERLSEPVFICQECGGPVAVIEGQEMRVESIDVSE